MSFIGLTPLQKIKDKIALQMMTDFAYTKIGKMKLRVIKKKKLKTKRNFCAK